MHIYVCVYECMHVQIWMGTFCVWVQRCALLCGGLNCHPELLSTLFIETAFVIENEPLDSKLILKILIVQAVTTPVQFLHRFLSSEPQSSSLCQNCPVRLVTAPKPHL